jgi:hypothetical protein
MKLIEAIAILTEHNLWRRGLPPYDEAGAPLPYTTRQLSKAIDVAIKTMEEVSDAANP